MVVPQKMKKGYAHRCPNLKALEERSHSNPSFRRFEIKHARAPYRVKARVSTEIVDLLALTL
jgi:hypothetical protein